MSLAHWIVALFASFACVLSFADGLFLFHVNVHGKHQSTEPLQFDQDTGGQNIYVNDLVRALASHPGVEKVVVATRVLRGNHWNGNPLSPIHAQKIELIPGTKNAWNVRFSLAGDQYLHKEDLWPHLDELAKQLVDYLRAQPRLPDAIHAHYADAGYVGLKVARTLGVPFFFTAHSLGILKKRALEQSKAGEIVDAAAVEAKFRFTSRRFPAELEAALNADLVITNSAAEIVSQWRFYSPFDENIEAFSPGVDGQRFFPGNDTTEREDAKAFTREFSTLADPSRPPVFTIARAEKTKNLFGLIQAFAANAYLRQHSNLIIATSCDAEMYAQLKEEAELNGISDRFLLLTGVSEKNAQLYRVIGRMRGVFANTSFYENFGLTLLEAAASGIPVVATRNGGPAEIVRRLENGITVDPFSPKSIGDGLEAVLRDRAAWTRFSANGVANFEAKFSWKAHAEKYVERVQGFKRGAPRRVSSRRYEVIPLEAPDLARRLDQFHFNRLKEKDTALVVTSPLPYAETLSLLKRHHVVNEAEILITDGGTRVFFGSEQIEIPGFTAKQLSQKKGIHLEASALSGRGITLVRRSISEVSPQIEPNDWLVLDFDEVVVRSKDFIGQEQAEAVLREKFASEREGVSAETAQRMAYETWKRLNLAMRKLVEIEAVEPELIRVANAHRAKGGRVLVLTARDENWALLTQLQASRVGLVLEAGDVHFAGQRPKGEVLRELLQSMPPAARAKVHYFDDRAQALLSAHEALAGDEREIRFYHYRVAEPRHAEFDADVVLAQLEAYRREGRIPSNAEVRSQNSCAKSLIKLVGEVP